MSSMTLKQIRDQLRDLHDNLETDASTVTELRVMANAIDARLAGMGEPTKGTPERQLFDLAHAWADNKIHNYQLMSQIEAIVAKLKAAPPIDAVIAGMGEPVAKVVAQDVNSHGYPRAIEHLLPIYSVDELLPVGTKLYTAPPIDLAAVREVIGDLREWGKTDAQLARRAEWLEAAIKGVAE